MTILPIQSLQCIQTKSLLSINKTCHNNCVAIKGLQGAVSVSLTDHSAMDN